MSLILAGLVAELLRMLRVVKALELLVKVLLVGVVLLNTVRLVEVGQVRLVAAVCPVRLAMEVMVLPGILVAYLYIMAAAGAALMVEMGGVLPGPVVWAAALVGAIMIIRLVVMEQMV